MPKETVAQRIRLYDRNFAINKKAETAVHRELRAIIAEQHKLIGLMFGALAQIRDARDYHAEHGAYPPGALAADQCFDDWAADVASPVLALVDAEVNQ